MQNGKKRNDINICASAKCAREKETEGAKSVINK